MRLKKIAYCYFCQWVGHEWRSTYRERQNAEGGQSESLNRADAEKEFPLHKSEYELLIKLTSPVQHLQRLLWEATTSWNEDNSYRSWWVSKQNMPVFILFGSFCPRHLVKAQIVFACSCCHKGLKCKQNYFPFSLYFASKFEIFVMLPSGLSWHSSQKDTRKLVQ